MNVKAPMIFAAILFAFPASEAGAGYAVSFSLPQAQGGSSLVNGVDGFDFIPTKDLIVDALGWFDFGGNGLLHNHPVGIYNTVTRSLLASANVDNASVLNPATDFRYTSIDPLDLLAGTKYTIIGYGQGPSFDPYVQNPSGGYSFGSDLIYQGFRTARASGIFLPGGTPDPTLTQSLFIGAHFRYSTTPVGAVSAVPEPVSVISLISGGICTAIFMSRRIRRSR